MPARAPQSIKNRESRIKNDRRQFQPASRRDWREWLAAHHDTSSGVWLVCAKKHIGIPSLTWDEAVEEALCFGWIDSIRKPIDDRLYQQLFTPRKPKSIWSGLNKKRVAALIRDGRMTPAGMAAIELAKQTGTWDALSDVDTLTEPSESRDALDRNAKARANWNALSPGEKKRFLYWLSNAKRQETQTARTKQIVTMVSRNMSVTEYRSASKR